MKIKIKRIYAPVLASDGKRILVDKLWPRGLSKDKAQIDFWAKELAPSTELRRYYHHDPKRWQEFRLLYFAELDTKPQALAELKARLSSDTTTLLFSSKEEQFNNAAALREYLQKC